MRIFCHQIAAEIINATLRLREAKEELEDEEIDDIHDLHVNLPNGERFNDEVEIVCEEDVVEMEEEQDGEVTA